MGKIVEKKKKGRPSLLDLQKRSLKQQQEQQQQSQQKIRNHKINKIPNSKITNPSLNSNSSAGIRRSTRRNPNPNSDPDEDTPSATKKRLKLANLKLPKNEDDDEEEDEEEVLGKGNSDEERDNSGSESCPDDGASSGSNLKKRKIDSISHGSGVKEIKSEKHSSAVVTTKQESTQQESKVDDGPMTPLPDKSLLLFILDRLQKKDTYGVFADPVDPEELPDYHEVIENPMDFSTVRKKLASGAYANLEQFEKDVFLICSNAMQYNAPDTIYFRQARSIQELAVKNFDNLRADSDDNEPEPEPKVVRRGRPPTKNLKRPPGRPPLERASSDFSEATLATAGGNSNRSNNEVRKASHSDKYGSTDTFARSLYGSRVGEAYIGWSAERYDRADDMLGSASKGILMKHGKKHIVLDETRRNTYNSYSLTCGQEPSVLTTFDKERKQLIAVGLHTEYGYARSLARFAAKVGPVAWKVASKKIEKCLPAAVKFGPGWVGENEAPAERPMQQQSPASVGQQNPPSSLPAATDTPSTPTQGVADSSGDGSAQKPQGEQLSETHKMCNKSNLNEESSKALSPPAVSNDATPVTSSKVSSTGAGPNLIAPEASASSPSTTLVSILNNGTGSMRPGNPHPINQTSTLQSRINGLNGSYGLNFAAQMGKMIGAARPAMFNLQSNPSIVTLSRTETQSPRPQTIDNNGFGEAKLLENSSTIKPIEGLPKVGSNPKVGSTPPDLNVGFQSPGSPVSGKADSVQPDLALQL
ncbi:bromodomain-containing protein DDB_G0270170-like [Chenopodium quinoa]|uniref:bromodomain-containing protein DDB_G0270170-like n=1 Tax=Chenopodium quinoa TaxID=63459 RepID=UPI000B7734D7|nr:bromodomain-containing protein DDB_G0270170-like [Chenopodium quinoa]XP_021753236.1 bromodomain-containing protein DDB_G0270170-like [Chenopodium quinoa]